tara:strand:+ start:48 stop:602 length:555 start_codon:yes stop_codon:yes gene_type:complete
MVAASVLPVALHKGKLYFLFGKENQLEDSAKGFSDFGGGVESGETIMNTALREAAEELSGFLGTSSSIQKLIKKNGGYHKVVVNDYHIHIFFMNYDENLPKYFTNFHRFMWNKMDKHMLNDSKLFEKQEIRWFCETELSKSMKLFRSFYRKMVEEIIQNMPTIRSFIKARSGRNNRRTRRMKGG